MLIKAIAIVSSVLAIVFGLAAVMSGPSWSVEVGTVFAMIGLAAVLVVQQRAKPSKLASSDRP